MKFFRIPLVALMLLSLALTGCDSKKDDHDHADGAAAVHKQFHKHGPHTKGECFRFDGVEDFSAEVALNGQNNVIKVLFTTYDTKGKKTIKADKLTLKRSASDESEFELSPIAAEGEEGMLEGFMLDDEGLKTAIKLKMVATITIDGKEYTGKTNPGHH